MGGALRIQYGEDDNQFGVLRMPSGDTRPVPVAVVIHGGFWGPDHGFEIMESFSEALTGIGYATWNLEYRRMGGTGGGYPSTFEDVSRAVDAVSDLAQVYPVAVDRVVIVGHSAGGHLALWATGRHRLPQDGGLMPRCAPSVNAKAAVAIAGVVDLEAMCAAMPAGGPWIGFLGGPPDVVPERYREASPAHLLPLDVPQELIHGDADDVVPIEVSRSYERKARAAGDEVRLLALPGVDHASFIDVASDAFAVVKDRMSSLLTRI